MVRTSSVKEKHQVKPSDFYGVKHVPLKAITRKPVVASAEENARNPRATSAKLRVAERTKQSGIEVSKVKDFFGRLGARLRITDEEAIIKFLPFAGWLSLLALISIYTATARTRRCI